MERDTNSKNLGEDSALQCVEGSAQIVITLQGDFGIMDIDHGFYMVKCNFLGDRERIMLKGPWMLFDHYLDV